MAFYEAMLSSHQSITSGDFLCCTASENDQLPSSEEAAQFWLHVDANAVQLLDVNSRIWPPCSTNICTNRRRRTTPGGWPTEATTCRAWTNGSTNSSASASCTSQHSPWRAQVAGQALDLFDGRFEDVPIQRRSVDHQPARHRTTKRENSLKIFFGSYYS